MSGSIDGGKVLFSTSAVGYYGPRGEEVLTEESPSAEDFLGSLSQEWESEARKAENFGARVILTRFGIVLGADGGALRGMIPLFKWGLGSPLGSGKQWFSWIHINDLVRIYLFLLSRPEVSGAVNCTSPHPVRNRRLTTELGKALGRPTFLPAVPGWILKIVLGEFGSVLLTGQRVFPERLRKAGFEFEYARIDRALRELAS